MIDEFHKFDVKFLHQCRIDGILSEEILESYDAFCVAFAKFLDENHYVLGEDPEIRQLIKDILE